MQHERSIQSLQKLRVPELKSRCKELGISNVSKLTKHRLVEAISQHFQAPNPALTPHHPDIQTALVPALATTTGLSKSNSLPQQSAAGIPAISHQSSQLTSPDSQVQTAHGALKSATLPSSASKGENSSISISRSTKQFGERRAHNLAGIKQIGRKTFAPLKLVRRNSSSPNTNTRAAANDRIGTLEGFRSRLEREHYVETSFLQVINDNLQAQRTSFSGIASSLYDDASTFAVAIRFYVSRLHHFLQLGSAEAWSIFAANRGLLGPDISSWPAVQTCEKVVEGIWRVGTSDEQKLYVFYDTGEVLGVEGSGTGLREDWKEYIRNIDSYRSLKDLIQSKNPIEFPGGVSRRIQAGPLSDVAYRAARSSCAPESFTGPKLDLGQMDSEALGRPTPLTPTNPHRIHMYLPEAKQVVSVHVPKEFHPALASIHRYSGTTEYVLRETGQTVGEEDGGVVELWQGILGCDMKGRSMDRSDFWAGCVLKDGM